MHAGDEVDGTEASMGTQAERVDRGLDVAKKGAAVDLLLDAEWTSKPELVAADLVVPPHGASWLPAALSIATTSAVTAVLVPHLVGGTVVGADKVVDASTVRPARGWVVSCQQMHEVALLVGPASHADIFGVCDGHVVS